ncbi:MAG: SprT family zinc-dependent metalloprotease [Myxococcota bacterium]
MQVEAVSKVQFGRTAIPYAIRRSARRKTVSVAVDPEDGGVILTAPVDVGVERLDRVVKDRAPWILDRLRLVRESDPKPSPREFVSGETFLYLGRQYRLRVVARKAGEAKLRGGWFDVPVQRGLKGPQRAEAARHALVGWYRDRAAQRLPERVEAWSIAAGGRPVGKVIISNQRRRWASCDARGSLRFNWRVIQAPLRLVDYVVAHELVHLRHRDHTAAFWRALEEVQQDFEGRRRALRELGSRLEW